MNSRNPLKLQDKIRVLIIPGSDPVGDWVASVLAFEQDMTFLGLVRDLTQAIESIEQLSPDVILIDISSGILQHGDLINHLAVPMTGAAIIVVAMMGEVDMVRQAMLYGAQGFLLKPFSETELLSSVRQAYGLLSQRRIELVELPRLLPGAQAEQAPRAEIVMVFSPKGGVGCTTVAINLAVALQAITEEQAILVDADLRFGDIDTALNLTATTSIGTLLPSLDELDDRLLDQALVRHDSGIQVLLAPQHLDAADAIRPEGIKQLLLRLSRLEAGYVVVDAWSALDDCTLSILDVSDHLVLVTTPQLTALRDIHRFMDVLNLLRYDLQKTMLVLNHCYQRSNVKLRDVERALGQPIAQTIEYTPQQITNSLNRGVPFIQEYRDSPAARDILDLAKHIAAQTPRPEPAGQETGTAATNQEEGLKRRGLFFRGQVEAVGR